MIQFKSFFSSKPTSASGKRCWRWIHLSSVIFWAMPITCIFGDAPTTQPTEMRYSEVRDFDDLCEYAKWVSRGSVAPTPELPEPLASWTYDDYTKVSYKPERATWFNQGLPFWLETFHRGFVQVDSVELYTLNPVPNSSPVVQRIAYSKDDFEYAEPLNRDQIPVAGHAGLKIVGRFPNNENAEEMLSFLGSSYFRGRSSDCVYGASARGLAIDIAMNKAEEFPDFRAFWIRMPSPEDTWLTVLAHLDSESVSGAYRFRLEPGGVRTQMHVDAKLYFRKTPEKVGVAPLTSMWIWGDGLKGPPKDARPAVHDSDGLLIRSGDQAWSWRAFARQSYPSVTSIDVPELHGFGLIQRNRAFYHYDDHNARYDKRPSVWVTPDTPWTNGRIELLELPGAHEGVDNLACYWLPNALPTEGQPVELSYTVSFFAGDPEQHNRLGRATNLSVDRDPAKDCIGIEVRFAGDVLRALPANCKLRIESDAIRGELANHQLNKTETGDWILTVDVVPDGKEPVELNWRLFSDQQPVSEEFRYLLPTVEPEFVYPAVYTRQE